MITSVAVQAYLARIAELFKEQGFDPSMNVIYDAEEAQTEEWISDELAGKHDADRKRMQRKGMTTKEDVRSKPFMALFWTRSSLEPIIRRPYRLIDSPDEGITGPAGKSTVNAKFRIACAFVSNKAEAVEDLEEAFAARFQSTYNVPVSLEFIYNSAEKRPEEAKTNFTVIQNMGEADLVNYKEGNLFAYAWGAEIHMNCVSEFAWSRVFPVEKVVVDLYDPNGIPLASLDASGKAHTHDYTADTGEVVPDVPDEPLIAFTRAEPHDYVPFAITAPYSGVPGKITPEAKTLIEGAVTGIGGEISLRGTDYMVVALMPLAANHSEGNDYDADVLATSGAISGAIKAATGDDYVVTPMPDGVGA